MTRKLALTEKGEMSYCRFSTDDFQCDLYCYEDYPGFTTHVAAIRYVYKGPLPPAIILDDQSINEWLNRHQKVQAMVDNADRIPIKLPHAGYSFNDPGLKSFLDRILYLKSIGYRVPDSTIADIREEIREALND